MHAQQNQMAKGLQFQQAGKLKKAAQCYSAVLKDAPGHPDALMLLGIVQYQNDDIVKAVRTLKKAVAATPDRAGAHFNLGLALQAQGARDAALGAFQRALDLEPANPDAKYCLGVALVQGGALEEGRAHLEPLIPVMGDNPGLFGWLGKALHLLGDFEGAARAFVRAVALDPDNLESLIGLALLPSTLVGTQTALSCAQKAANLAPDNAEALACYARWLERSRQLDDAETYAKRAMKVAPQSQIARVIMARVQLAQGDAQGALERGQGVLSLPNLIVENEREAHAVIGAALDKLGRYDEAFAAFQKKNDCALVLADALKIDRAATAQLIARTHAWLNSDAAAALARREGGDGTGGDGAGATPIFFIGFPRSGTTLMEQILGSHPALQTSGELPALETVLQSLGKVAKREIDYPQDLETLSDDQLEALRQLYWRCFEADLKAPPGERTVVDKNPYNLLYLPLMRALFPSAKVIMALRDPRDVCLSNFMQIFAVNHAMVQMKDARATAQFYVDLMALWREARDGLGFDWLEYRYEDLVDDFDATVARVLEFLGLAWDEGVRDYAQTAKDTIVSTPSYTGVTGKLSRKAIGRWKNYATPMGEAFALLGDDVRALGYADD